MSTVTHSPATDEKAHLAQLGGATIAVYAFDVAGGRINHIWTMLNPDKLRPWTTG